MIAKATAISHGINALRYITGESAHKKHPEKIHHIASYWFDAAFTAGSMLEAIKFKCADRPRLKNNFIRIEISPAEEYTRNFTDDDWKKLWDEFGYINNDHQIYLRAQRATECIVRRRDWTTASNRHYDHIRQASDDCQYVLRTMQRWSWYNYVMLLGLKAYNVRERLDSKGILRGYTLRKGNIIIKSSELKGRAFMVSRIEYLAKTQCAEEHRYHDAENGGTSSAPSVVQPTTLIDYTRYRAGTTSYTLEHDGKEQRYYIPEKVMDLSDDEFDYR